MKNAYCIESASVVTKNGTSMAAAIVAASASALSTRHGTFLNFAYDAPTASGTQTACVVGLLLGFLRSGVLFLFAASVIAGCKAARLSSDFDWKFRLAATVRVPIMVFIVVPLSFLFNLYRRVRIKLRARKLLTASTGATMTREHEGRTKKVVDQIAAWDAAGRTKRMRTARPNWSSMSIKVGSNKGEAHRIDVSHLNHILEVDEENLTITCEPMVTMGDLTEILLPRGLALLCQVEMESLTIGGLSLGFGMETNSHVIGWFQETVLAFEFVTAESPPRVRTVTREDDPDVFYSMAHSVGTLGFLVSVKVRLTKAKPFVRMKYIMTRTPEELRDVMVELSEADDKAPQFLEATAYSQDRAVVQCGEMCDEPTSEDRSLLNPINRWYKPFYYCHLRDLLESGCKTYEEIIPLKHYYHRFTRSIFWEIQHMIPFASHPLYRFFWGWMGAPEVSLLKLFQGPVIRKNNVRAHVVQESVMPVRRLVEGLDKFEKWWDIYPLLIFPLRTYNRGIQSGFLNPHGKNLAPDRDAKEEGATKNWGIWVDVAAYGVPRQVRNGQTFEPKRTIREFHHWTESVGGWCMYYTDLYCTRREYRRMFDHTLWDQCRARLNAEDAFPEPFDKLRPEPGIVDLTEEEAAEAKLNGMTAK